MVANPNCWADLSRSLRAIASTSAGVVGAFRWFRSSNPRLTNNTRGFET